MSIEQRAIEVIAEQLCLDVSEITPTSTFEELGIDSLDQLEAVMALEEAFEIEIPDEVCDAWESVGDAIESIKNAQSQ